MTQDIDVGKLSEQINDKADRDLWNTVPNVWNNTLNTSQITNCITEIPQDIKLELIDGTLTLKAGSKVYVPNGKKVGGSLRFDEVVIAYDLSLTQSWGSSQTFLLFYDTKGSRLRIYDTGRCYSGTTSVSDGAYYNTNENKLYIYDGGSLNFQASLPIAIITGQSPTITSVDQIFNGFGYIGSTVFALPGVKGLIPNGRNEDGSLKNIEVTTDSVQTYSINNLNGYFCIKSNGKLNYDRLNYWDYRNDINYFTHGDERFYMYQAVKATTDSDGKITSFTPKTAFHALNYNDKSTISGWGMPSERYIDLTLGASGVAYTAPGNGYYLLSKFATEPAQNIAMKKFEEIWVLEWAPIAKVNLFCWVPVQKGETISIHYSATGTTHYFRFYYAEGEK